MISMGAQLVRRQAPYWRIGYPDPLCRKMPIQATALRVMAVVKLR
jgi:hypothetical protein